MSNIIAIAEVEIRQDADGRFSLNDLHRAAGEESRHKPGNWTALEQTQALIREIEKAGIPAIQSKQGLGTFVVKELVYAYAMWISPPFHLKVIRTFDATSHQQAQPASLSRMDILKLAMESEEARIKAEAERDRAVATKAEIGSRREATAMATASAAMRQVNRLTEQLGRNMKHATMIAVEKAVGRKFGKQDWRPLRDFCKSKGLQAEKVTDARYGEVKAWPAEAWSEVYGIDLGSLFPTAGLQ